MVEKSHVGMKILGVLTVVGGILMMVAGIGLWFLGEQLQDVAMEEGLLVIPLLPIALAYSAMAIPIVIVGLFFAVFGYYVFVERFWAYVLLFIITVLGLLSSVVYFNVYGLLVGGLIAFYLFYIRNDFFGKDKDVQYYEP
jgi:hypothetical protein